ncbi:hypothetical protein C8R48DRAFT_767734 [Suillus tomentosus]|nr:hypothetical protein C8R48DRAFT_767734 [Suillus tomentosus]
MSKDPIIIGEAPTHRSFHSHGQRAFANGDFDRNGPPHLAAFPTIPLTRRRVEVFVEISRPPPRPASRAISRPPPRPASGAISRPPPRPVSRVVQSTRCSSLTHANDLIPPITAVERSALSSEYADDTDDESTSPDEQSWCASYLLVMVLTNSRNVRKAQLVSSGLGQHLLPGANLRRRYLLTQMQRLMDPTSLPTGRSPSTLLGGRLVSEEISSHGPTELETCLRKRRTIPDKSTDALYANWRKLIPTLVDPQLKYHARTLGQALEITHDVISACATLSCARNSTSILCLFFDRFVSIDVLSCECSSLPQVLLHHGLFPTAPSQPRMAISVDLLSFYRALFERSCDAINALASALKTHYSRRGFQVTDARGDLVQDPFRRGLGYAVQWYDVLQVEIEHQVDTVLQQSRDRVASFQPWRHTPSNTESTASTVLQRGRCAPLLVQRCPACFGGMLFGRPISEGGDIHVATDGNFHHRHRRSAGDCPRFYEPTYFLSKQFVDTVGRRIDAQRKRPATTHASLVPDEAIDLCENAYEAADGKKQKAAMDSFDNTGIMALICRHDIPLFLPTLIRLASNRTTVTTLYDVGCILAQSLSKDLLSRLRFATTAMHAYGHEWACQLVYNPRCVERSSSRRLWLIDRQATAIGAEMKADLGDWIKRRLKRGIKDQASAGLTLSTAVKHPLMTTSSMGQPTTIPALNSCSKELDTVLTLQTDLDISDQALQATRTMLEKEAPSDNTLDVLESLQRGHNRLMTKVEALYSSLNVHDRFPELDGVNLDFLFEWDKLDRAVGGSQQTLGTKLHQHTRKAIAKRQPALMTAIRKFNSYCERLESLYDPVWNIPLPTPLPTKLAELCGDQTLMQDVWVTPSMGEVPQWLEDSDIRDGIRALLKRDRCLEEQKRLGLEADNLCRFFGEELTALELSLRLPENERFLVPLQQKHTNFIRLQTRWSNPLASSVQFTSHVEVALNHAIAYSGAPQNTAPQLASVTMQNLAEDEQVLPEEDDLVDDEPEQAALADILEGDIAGAEFEDDEDLVSNIRANIVWDSPEGLLIDDFCAPRSQDSPIMVSDRVTTRVTSSTGPLPCQEFEPRDISFLASPTAFLNDVCINGCAVLLQMDMPNSDVAIFSTFDLPRIRYHATDDMLWRNTRWTCYWEKDVWVLPIHRPAHVGHWVVCVIYLSTKELRLFDSLAERKPWKHDVKDIMKLVCRLLMVARQRGKEVHIDLDGWVARPLNLKPYQTNGYDCGVWILAAMIAVLRGHHITGLREDEMSDLRHYLRTRVLAIPVV